MSKNLRLNLLHYLEPNLGKAVVTYAGLKFDCPKCDFGNKKNLEVKTDPEQLVFHCWSCHYKGYVTKLLKDYSVDNSWKNLAEFKYTNTNISTKEQENSLVLPEGKIPFYLKKEVEDYLINERGLNKNLLIKRRISYVYDEDHKLYNHIIFPFYDSTGTKLKGFSVQNFETGKYKNFGKRNFIPYIEFININYPITITEGIYDALSVYNAIPLLGDDISNTILQFCKDKKIILAIDNDVKEHHKQNLIDNLKMYGVKLIYSFQPGKYKDLNEFNQKDKETLINKYYNVINLLCK